VEQLDALAPELPEERNMRQVALLIARCALERKESRGAHFRTDYPETRDAFARHSVVSRQADVTFR
jgi:aspartate oxidase